MKLKSILSSTAVAATLLFAGAAHADVYTFTVTGDYAATWQIDTDLAPDSYGLGEGFAYYDVVGSYDGAVSEYADIIYYNAASGGGVVIDDYNGGQVLLVTDGPQLYSGSEDSPSFMTGTYALTEYQGTGNYTLTISAVPEPATYGMMLAGMGLVGVALRRRQAK